MVNVKVAVMCWPLSAAVIVGFVIAGVIEQWLL